MRRTAVLVWATVLLASASLMGCGSSTPDGSAGTQATPQDRSSTYVSIDATGSLDGDTVAVSGTATVPDGAVILYSMGEGVHELPDGRVDGAEGSLVVTRGAFAFTQDVADWPRPIPIYLTFTMKGQMKGQQAQPPQVIELYGADGARIQGPDVRPIPGLTVAVEEFSVGD